MTRIRVHIWFFIGWSYLILVYPWSLRAKYLNYRGKVNQQEALAYKVMRLFSKLLVYVSGSKINIIGREHIPKDTAVVFVSNHQGHLDSLIIEGFLRGSKGFIAIDTFEKTPLLGTWMKYMGCVFVDRENARTSLVSMQLAAVHLNRGLSMVVFPEGRLNDGEDTLAFQKGWLRIVTKSGAPIVPITISGSHRIMSHNGKHMSPAKIDFIISKPIDVSGLKRSNEQAFLQKLRDIIHAPLLNIQS